MIDWNRSTCPQLQYVDNGQVQQAIELFEYVVQVGEKTMGEHFRILTQNELARAYKVNGQVKEAVDLWEHVAKVTARILPEYHPNRLLVEGNLATAYYDNGQVEKGIELLEYVITIGARTYRDTILSAHGHKMYLKKCTHGLGWAEPSCS